MSFYFPKETLIGLDVFDLDFHCLGLSRDATTHIELIRKFLTTPVKDSHVLIHGTMGDYSVHLGSAMVHRQPGGALFVVAVHSQHRGRLFLPFADDDPKTAEVLSKVLMFARDDEMKDPAILQQIRLNV